MAPLDTIKNVTTRSSGISSRTIRPCFPILVGEDILLKKSENLACGKGMKVFVDAEELPVDSFI